MIEFNNPVPKKFARKSQSQPLPIIMGEWSEETIKNLWPSYIGLLKSSSVVIQDLRDSESLYNAGFFGQNSFQDRERSKRCKDASQHAGAKRQKKNWDQLIISKSLSNLSSCLTPNKSDSNNESEKNEPKADQSSESNVPIEDSGKTNEGRGMTVDLSDSEEEEGGEEEEEEEENDLLEALSPMETDGNEIDISDSSTRLNLSSSSSHAGLILSFEEAFFLSYALGCLSVVTENEEILDHEQLFKTFSEASKDFMYRYVTYHYYRSKGWIVKPGIKFGGDFLLYKQGPPFYHASFIIIIDKANLMSWTTLIGLNRLAGSVNKELIITTVSIDGEPTLQSMLSASVTETLYRRWVPTSEVSSCEN